MYNLIPRASCLSDIGRQGLSIIGHLNINSIRNKFLSIQFLINGFSVPHRLDRNRKGSGILLYVRDEIIVLPLNRYSLPLHIEVLFFEFQGIENGLYVVLTIPTKT